MQVVYRRREIDRRGGPAIAVVEPDAKQKLMETTRKVRRRRVGARRNSASSAPTARPLLPPKAP